MAPVERFNIFRWIAIVGVVALGLAACSGEISEPEDSSAIRPLEESVPAPTTAAPTSAAPTTVVALTTMAPTTAAPTTSAAPTTTTEAPYDGRFTEEELEIIEAYLDAQEAYNLALIEPSEAALNRLRETHTADAAGIRVGHVSDFHENSRGEWPAGTRPAARFYGKGRDGDQLDLLVCLLDDLIVTDATSGEVTNSASIPLFARVAMLQVDGVWRLAQSLETQGEVGEPCGDNWAG
jgi:hypothetical protein